VSVQTVTAPRWSGISLTCPQQVVNIGLVEFNKRHDKWTNGCTTALSAELIRRPLQWLSGAVQLIATKEKHVKNVEKI